MNSGVRNIPARPNYSITAYKLITEKGKQMSITKGTQAKRTKYKSAYDRFKACKVALNSANHVNSNMPASKVCMQEIKKWLCSCHVFSKSSALVERNSVPCKMKVTDSSKN